MPIIIQDKTDCTGCSACVNACPVACISMHADASGFEYPAVDSAQCINCEKCTSTCPIINPIEKQKTEIISVNAVWSLDADLRFNSTSGGVFSEIANAMLDTGAIVAGAKYAEDNSIEHCIVDSKEGIELLRQSKYAQSRIGNVYKIIKEELKTRDVLFCGSPCQVAGLKKYLDHEYDNLFTIDFICRGVNSPKAYKSWISELEEKNKSKVRRVWFKYKIHGWKQSPRCTRIDFENGKYIVQRGDLNPFMYGYLGPNLYIRPSCSNCRFKSESRYSDITLGDFWKVDASLDDDKGTSMVQINTEKGLQMLDSIKQNVFAVECSAAEIRRGNVMMDESVEINPRSEEFLSLIDSHNFTKMVEKYSDRSPKARVKYFVKKVLHRIKLYN